MIIYIHGFRSTGEGNKAKLLRQYFPTEKIVALDLKHQPFTDIADLQDIITDAKIDNEKILLIGSSLGGFYARYLAARNNVTAVLINPSDTPHLSLTNYGLIDSFGGGTFEWNKTHTEQLRTLYQMLHTQMLENTLQLYFFLSTDDEVIDHSRLKYLYPNVKEYDNSEHIFTRFEEIMPDIKDIYNQTVSSYKGIILDSGSKN